MALVVCAEKYAVSFARLFRRRAESLKQIRNNRSRLTSGLVSSLLNIHTRPLSLFNSVPNVQKFYREDRLLIFNANPKIPEPSSTNEVGSGTGAVEDTLVTFTLSNWKVASPLIVRDNRLVNPENVKVSASNTPFVVTVRVIVPPPWKVPVNTTEICKVVGLSSQRSIEFKLKGLASDVIRVKG